MDKAAEESKRKAEAEATRKRQALADQLQSQQQNKRRRLNPTNEVARLFAASNPEGLVRVQSVSALPHAAVVDLLVSALQGVAPSTLTEAISVSSAAAAIPELRTLTLRQYRLSSASSRAAPLQHPRARARRRFQDPSSSIL